METREELLKSPEYWNSELQFELFRRIEAYMEEKHLNRTELAKHLGCTKGYVTQLLSGNFDHKMSKFFELSLAIGKIPVVKFEDIDKYIQEDKRLNQNMPYSITSKCIKISIESTENNILYNDKSPVQSKQISFANINDQYSTYIKGPQA